MRPHDTFGPYDILELLGRGGMGEVFRAYDRERERTVALKLLHPHLVPDAGYLERFRRESRVAARLSSPHVIPIHDYGEIDGRLFLDMRLAQGQDLASLLQRNGPLPAGRAVEIVSQTASALDAAHEDGLVHRDVKPSNVLVSTDRGRDFAYLVDFGIVRAFDGSIGHTLTATGAIIGTPAYMAPEVFAGEPLDHRADVYALACLLFEALSGQPPFGAASLPTMIHRHLHAPPPSLAAQRPELPRSLDTLVARALAKSPDARPSSAGELAELARDALQASPVAVPERSVRTLTGAHRADAGRRRTLTDPHGRAFHDVAYTPDGRILVAVVDGPGGVVLFDAEQGTVVREIPDTREIGCVAVSPDGRLLAGGTGQGDAVLWDVDSGRELGRIARHDGAVRAVTFGPDGGRVATASEDHHAAVWDLASGLRVLNCRHRFPVRDVAFAPDGRWLATAEHGAQLFDTSSGARRARPVRRFRVDDIVWGVGFTPDGAWLAGGGADGVATSWHVATGEVMGTAQHADEVLDVAYSSDGARLLTAGSDGAVVSWDVEARRPPRRVELGHEVYGVVAHPRQPGVAAAACADGAVHVLEIER